MSKIRGNILLSPQIQPMSATWEWQDQTQGLVKWTFSNPNNVQLSAILVRGVEENGQVTEIYPFGNAFWPLYWKNFGTPFITGQASPLTDQGLQINQAPLGVITDLDGKPFVAFVFTLSPKQSWSMLEGGFQGCQPAAISTEQCNFVQTSPVTIKYNQVQQCSQYNKQAGTNFPCPKNPIKVPSAVFSIQENTKPLITDPIKLAKSKNRKGWKKIEKALLKGDIVSFLQALRNYILGL